MRLYVFRKTEELIRRMKRAKFARQRVEIFKPAIDTRYSEGDVVSHDSNSISSTPIDSSASILLFTSEIDVVGIDEAQFFDSGLIDVCNQLANNGVRVIIAGLDMDFKGIPFGPMPALCAIADEVSKVHAICVKCGQFGFFAPSRKECQTISTGETAQYEPLCRECYQRALQEDRENHKDLTAVKPSHTDEVAHQISGYHGKEKITFDSFIRGSICCALIVGLLILLKGSAVYCYLFRSMAHRLYDLPTRQILPVQITFQK